MALRLPVRLGGRHLRRARRLGDRDRGAWLCFTLGILSLLAGDIYWFAVVVPLGEIPFPSPADALYLGLYPACYVGLTLLIRSRVPGLPRAAWLDGLIGAVIAASLVAAVAFRPVVDALDGSAAAVATTIAYPAADVLMLAFVAGALVTFGRTSDRTLGLLAVALTSQTLADCVYLVQAPRGTYVEGGPLDILWIVAVLTIATAARQPANALAPASRRDTGRSELLIGIFAVITGGLMVVNATAGLDPVSEVLLAASVLLVMLRLGLAVREIRGLEHNRVEALTDELTGLGNRRAFWRAAGGALAAPDAQPVAVILMDLDRFKEINDTLGHDAGDDAAARARAAAAALRAPSDTSRAWAATSSSCCWPSAPTPATLARRRSASARRSSAPFGSTGCDARVSASVGIAVYPDDGDDAADAAAQRRRRDVPRQGAGRDRLPRSTPPSTTATARERLELERRPAHAAIERGELVLHYQPKVDLADAVASAASRRSCAGSTRRAACSRPTRSSRSPRSAASCAPLTRRGRSTWRCAQQRAWREDGHRRCSVAVNLSARNLQRRRLRGRHVAERARARGLPGRRLALEITENVLMRDPDARDRRARAACARSASRSSLDDFGTGYSRWRYLKRLPLDELKIDRSFVTRPADDPQDAAIVRSTVELARTSACASSPRASRRRRARAAARLRLRPRAGLPPEPPAPAEAVSQWLAARPAQERRTAGMPA